MKKISIYILSFTLLFSCKKSEQDVISPSATIYHVDAETSSIGWAGSMDSQTNTGTFGIESTSLSVEDGKIVSGTFKIPILSLAVTNLEGASKAALETHLKSSDFFNFLIHPNASFTILKVSPYNGKVTEGMVAGANSVVSGKFTMLGVSRNIEFYAKIANQGSLINIFAMLEINRLDYGMSYASDPAVPAHYIEPQVDIILSVLAKP